MKLVHTLISALFVMTISSASAAGEVKTFSIGDTEVVYDFQPIETGGAILTLNALVSETNNSLRGLKNTDQRRLSKLGQLIYQCKLMLYKHDKNDHTISAKDPILVSRNYSLFTGVDLRLAREERVGIRAEALQTADDNSLFTPTLGSIDPLRKMWETVGEKAAINLKQINVNVLNESNIIETSDSIDIVARFPIFQLEKPVSQWSYNFNLKNFKQAIQHIDENCTPTRFLELIKQKTWKSSRLIGKVNAVIKS